MDTSQLCQEMINFNLKVNLDMYFGWSEWEKLKIYPLKIFTFF